MAHRDTQAVAAGGLLGEQAQAGLAGCVADAVQQQELARKGQSEVEGEGEGVHLYARELGAEAGGLRIKGEPAGRGGAGRGRAGEGRAGEGRVRVGHYWDKAAVLVHGGGGRVLGHYWDKAVVLVHGGMTWGMTTGL